MIAFLRASALKHFSCVFRLGDAPVPGLPFGCCLNTPVASADQVFSSVVPANYMFSKVPSVFCFLARFFASFSFIKFYSALKGGTLPVFAVFSPSAVFLSMLTPLLGKTAPAGGEIF